MIYGTMAIDGTHYPVTNLFDLDGDETDDISLAMSCVVRVADDVWEVVELDPSDIRPVQ